MRKPGLGVIGFGLIGIGSTMFASPASAAIDCGPNPTGGTVTQSGDYCQAVFSTAGDYHFTVPTSANQLFALVVGSGAGSLINANGNIEGYAGSAGKVHYKDMTDSIGFDLAIHIGTGGVSGTDSAAASGGDSNVVSQATSNYAISYGAAGSQTSASNSCTSPIWEVGFISVGEGARTVNSLVASGGACVAGEGRGVNPALGDVDSDGTATPAIFSDLNQTFGTGGRIKRNNDDVALPALTYGDGAGFQVAASTFSDVQTSGGNGIAYLRWRHVASLAATGSNSMEASALAVGLIALGTGLTVASRMRRRASK